MAGGYARTRGRRRTGAGGLLRASLAPALLLAAAYVIERALDLGLDVYLAAEWGTSARRDMYLLASSVLVASALIEMALVPFFASRSRDAGGADAALLAAAPAAAGLLVTLTATGAAAAWLLSGTAGAGAAEMLGAIACFALAALVLAVLAMRAGEDAAAGRFVAVAVRLPVVKGAAVAAAAVGAGLVVAPAAGLAAGAAGLVLLRRDAIWRLPAAASLAGLAAALSLFLLNAYPVLPRVLVERLLLASMADGTLAAIDFAHKTTTVFGLAGFAVIGIASLGPARRRRDACARALAVAALMTPVAIALALLAEPLVRLIYERGSFDAADTAAVSELTRLLAPAVPFVSGLPLLVPAIAARRRTAALGAVAGALALHAAACALTLQGGDARIVALSFDVEYALLFGVFYALARPQARAPAQASV